VASSLRLHLDPVDIGLFGGDFVYVVLYLGRVDVVPLLLPLLLCVLRFSFASVLSSFLTRIFQPMLQDGSYPPSRPSVQYLISGTLYLGLFCIALFRPHCLQGTAPGPNSSPRYRYTWTYDDLDLGDSKTPHGA
jgi:hypothetical protein